LYLKLQTNPKQAQNKPKTNSKQPPKQTQNKPQNKSKTTPKQTPKQPPKQRQNSNVGCDIVFHLTNL
jgi:hypothetical protein